MTKWELIRVALNELNKQWDSGESYDAFDVIPSPGFEQEEVHIRWNPALSKDAHKMTLPKAMVITRRTWGYFSCAIQDSNLMTGLPSSQRHEKMISDKKWYYFATKLNHEFNALRKKIVEYKKYKENNAFLSDLVKVFPRTLDGALLGDDYDE